jgi:hypothetical protein
MKTRNPEKYKAWGVTRHKWDGPKGNVVFDGWYTERREAEEVFHGWILEYPFPQWLVGIVWFGVTKCDWDTPWDPSVRSRLRVVSRSEQETNGK